MAKFCSEAGCLGIAVSGKWCPKHVADNREKRQRSMCSEYDRYYDTSGWRKARMYKLHRFPMCEVEGCNKPATDVHHLNGDWKLTGDWREFINQENLQALCHAHHSAITMKENHERGCV